MEFNVGDVVQLKRINTEYRVPEGNHNIRLPEFAFISIIDNDKVMLSIGLAGIVLVYDFFSEHYEKVEMTEMKEPRYVAIFTSDSIPKELHGLVGKVSSLAIHDSFARIVEFDYDVPELEKTPKRCIVSEDWLENIEYEDYLWLRNYLIDDHKHSDVPMLFDGKHFALIDKYCADLVRYFNDIGLKTQFCCQGHTNIERYYILFDASVTDDDIKQFLLENRTCRALNAVEFNKCTRFKDQLKGEEFLENWELEITDHTMGESYFKAHLLYENLMEAKHMKEDLSYRS